MNRTPRLSDLPITCASCALCPAQGCDLRARPYDQAAAILNRRTFLAGSAGSIALMASRAAVTAQTVDSSEATAETCVTLTPERTEGPYYIDDLLLRDDITEGKEGVPLDLAITVMDVTTCEPVADAAVDIWHTDALGSYSGVSGGMGNSDTSGQTWMRGVQLTDAEGVARITTIHPGWYVGRCIHIHLKVHLGGTAENGTYVGGSTAHTGQLFFDDAISDTVAQVAPYSTRLNVPRTLNEQDGVLNGAFTEPGFFVDLVRIDEADITRGFNGTVTLGINRSL